MPVAAALRPALAVLLLAGACGLPRDADLAPSDQAGAVPAPTLLPDAIFDAVTAGTAPAAARLDAEAAALAARAEALAARAETLDAPVIEPAMRDRLEAAQARPAG